MNFNEKLEQYILEHTQSEENVLKELFRETHLKIYHPRMLSGHLQGKILAMLCKMIKPDNILEIGTYTGYSAISMAFAIDNNSKIYTIDNNDEIEDFTRTYFKKAGVENKIEFLIGDAIEIIPQMDINFDIVFIDGNKQQYSEYYDLVFDKVVTGGYVFADNALWSGKVVEDNIKNNDYDTKGIIKFNEKIQNDNRIENVLFPVRDGLMVMRKK